MHKIRYEYRPKEEVLTLEQLKEIAAEVGITEEQWRAALKEFEDNLSNGQDAVKHGNWDSAVEKLKEAVAFNPYHLDALQTYARALLGRFSEKGTQEDVPEAEEMVERSLLISPGNSLSQQLLNQVETGEEAAVLSKIKGK